MDIDIRISEKIIPSFYESWRAYKNPKYLNVYEKGGRGSSKSTTIAIKVIMNRMQTLSHALVVRKYAKTIRGTVRNQIIWALYHLEVQDSWEWSSSSNGEMTMTYIPTGTKIFFEGADGDKVKGWKTPDFPTTDIFFEEIADYKTDEELSSIKLSIVREILPEGYKYTFFHAYNPPKRRQSWVNKLCETQFIPDNMYVHHSTYLDNIYLPKEFRDMAEHTRMTDPRRYQWEYLGYPIGAGLVPFENLEFREITDDEFNAFDNFYQGNDWGYAADPNAFVVWHFDATRRRIFAAGEIYGVKISLEDLADKIIEKGWHRQTTTADSAEPRSISRMKTLGCKFTGASKGPGSVEFGEKWLDELESIIIDPKRTPNIAREFESIDYEVDRDGNVMSRLSGADNHTIDATRYAFESVNKKGIKFLK